MKNCTGEVIKAVIEVKIDERFCKGCGLCVAVCPADVLVIKETVNAYGVNAASPCDGSECKGCLRCTDICPDAAIEIYCD